MIQREGVGLSLLLMLAESGKTRSCVGHFMNTGPDT